jgi:hypothetical protein
MNLVGRHPWLVENKLALSDGKWRSVTASDMNWSSATSRPTFAPMTVSTHLDASLRRTGSCAASRVHRPPPIAILTVRYAGSTMSIHNLQMLSTLQLGGQEDYWMSGWRAGATSLISKCIRSLRQERQPKQSVLAYRARFTDPFYRLSPRAVKEAYDRLTRRTSERTMDPRRRRRLEAAGWRVGSTREFLQLSAGEAAYVEMRLALSERLRAQRRRGGWTQHELARVLRSSRHHRA